MKFVHSTLIFMLISSIGISQSSTFYTNADLAGGDWSDSGSWYELAGGSDADGVPDADDNVLIGNGGDITVTGTEACDDLSIGDDGSIAFLTIDNGAHLTVGDRFVAADSADFADIEIYIDGTLQVDGLFYVDIKTYADVWLDINIGSDGLLDMNSTSTNHIYIWKNTSTAWLTVDGTLDCEGNLLNYVRDNGTFEVNIGTNGSMEVAKIYQQRLTEASTKITTNIKGGTLDVDSDIRFALGSGGVASNNTIDMNFTNSPTVNCGRRIAFPTKGTLNNGTNASTFNFDGASAHDIATNSTIEYYNLVLNGGAGEIGTLDGALPAGQLLGTLTVGTGAQMNFGANTCATTAGFDNQGTTTADAALTVGTNFSNSGTITQSAAMTVGGTFNNSGTFTGSSTIDVEGNFTNSSGLTVGGNDVNIAGNWNNTGTYTKTANDDFIFDGTGAQLIDGATDWYNITFNNSSTGVTFNSGAHTIENILDIDNGDVTAGGGSVTLLSAGTTAQFAEIEDPTNDQFIGSMTVQRRIVSGSQGFTSIASPVDGSTVDQWHDGGIGAGQEFILSGDGFTGADYDGTTGGTGGAWVNTYTYDETVAGTMDNGWEAATNVTNATGEDNNYKAHYIYTDAATYNIAVSGAPTQGNKSIPLTYTVSAGPLEDGWNLIGNPYACTIDWESIRGSIGSLVDGYLVYSSEYGNYAYYTGGGGGSLGATRYIPSSQGFWVRSTGDVSLAINESDKAPTQDPSFIRAGGIEDFLKIHLTGDQNGYKDEALIFANNSYDNNHNSSENDITKLHTQEPDYAPTMYTMSQDGIEMAFNKVNDMQSIDIPLMAVAGTYAQGNYTLAFEIPDGFFDGACITLEDLHTGNVTNLLTDTSYTYATSDTTTTPRFLIHMAKAFDTDYSNATCYGSNDGQIELVGNGLSGSFFQLLDLSGTPVSAITASSDTVTFNNIPAGEYTISTNIGGGCGVSDQIITIEEAAQVIASFDFVLDTLDLNNGDVLEVTNNSLGMHYSWDFGDGNTSTDANPTHTYSTVGVYPVELTVDNENIGMCTQTETKNLVVIDGSVSVEQFELNQNVNAFVSNGVIVLDFDFDQQTEVKITLNDMNGKQLIKQRVESVYTNQVNLNEVGEIADGVYFVSIQSGTKRVVKKIVVQ